MSAESIPPFPSSAAVLRIRLLLSDVVAVFSLNQDLFHRHQDTVQELLHLDCALLEVERSIDILSTMEEKVLETFEQSRRCFVEFLEKCKLDPIFGADENKILPTSFDSKLLPDDKYIEGFRSAINGLRKDLNALLRIEIGPVPIEAPTSSTENPSSENLWPHPSSTSSLVLEDEDTAENFRLAQLLINYLEFDNSQYLKTVTSTNQNGDSVASLSGNQNPEHRRSPLPSRHINSAHEHALYQNASTGPDGLYHCPWEGKNLSCNHQPTHQRYKYNLNVDAHLKPYHCKVEICRHASFASRSILFRHEREAHGMHGIGDRFILCPARGCERGLPDQGFRRHWNLVDHMRRVHNCSPTTHKVDGCTKSCFQMAVKKKLSAVTVEAGIPTFQSEFDSPTTEDSTISGVPVPDGLRTEKKTEESIPKSPKSRQSAKKARKSGRVRKFR